MRTNERSDLAAFELQVTTCFIFQIKLWNVQPSILVTSHLKAEVSRKPLDFQ